MRQFQCFSHCSGRQALHHREDGDIHVVGAGPEYELLATHSMGEICLATPAVSDGQLFIRTQHHLVAVGENAVSYFFKNRLSAKLELSLFLR